MKHLIKYNIIYWKSLSIGIHLNYMSQDLRGNQWGFGVLGYLMMIFMIFTIYK